MKKSLIILLLAIFSSLPWSTSDTFANPGQPGKKVAIKPQTQLTHGSFLYLKYQLGAYLGQGDVRFELVNMEGRSLRRYLLLEEAGTLSLDIDVPNGLYLGLLKVNGRVVAIHKISHLE